MAPGHDESDKRASKIHLHFAVYSAEVQGSCVYGGSPSADADVEKAVICPSVQQREINSATLLLTTIQEVFTLVCNKRRFPILHTHIMNLMTGNSIG